MPRPLPQAVLQALPTTPGSSPGSAHPQGSSPAPAHHTWLLPRLCPSSQAPLQALPTSPGPAHCLRLRPPHQDPSPGPAHSPERPVARCTSGRRSHSAALLLAHVAGTGPSTAVPETRPDGLVWWPGHRALTEAEFSADTQSTGKSGRCEAAGGPATQRSWWLGGQRDRMPAAVCARGRAWAGPFRPGPRLASGTRGHALPPSDHARAARWPWP